MLVDNGDGGGGEDDDDDGGCGGGGDGGGYEPRPVPPIEETCQQHPHSVHAYIHGKEICLYMYIY